MADKVKVNLRETLKIMAGEASSARRLANLPEDIGLWLYWRIVMGNRVPSDIVEQVTEEEITEAMVNNFYSRWYGIGKKQFATFEDLYEHINSKDPAKGALNRGARYKIKVQTPPMKEIEKMIENCEVKYGKKVEKALLKRR